MSNLTIKYQEKAVTSNPTGENYLAIIDVGAVRSYEEFCFLTVDIKTTLEKAGLQAKFIEYDTSQIYPFLRYHDNPVIEVDRARVEYKAFMIDQIDCFDSSREDLLNTPRDGQVHFKYSQDGYNWTPATIRFTVKQFWNQVIAPVGSGT